MSESKSKELRRGKLLTKGFLREIGYDGDGKAVMIITPTYLRSTPTIQYCIAQRDAWMYSEEHNPMFKEAMFYICTQIHENYQLGIVTAQKLGILAGVIQEGIDELIAAPPAPAKAKTIIGEASITVNGKKVSRDLTMEDLPKKSTEEVVGVI